VVLAGFMRILTPGFVQHYAGRLINIHPSLLPAFTGLNTHQRAIDAGCKVAGATVHQVTAELDHGATWRRPWCRCCRATRPRRWPRVFSRKNT
jgi:phosphoribosylglycinamide formyltransferase-1